MRLDLFEELFFVFEEHAGLLHRLFNELSVFVHTNKRELRLNSSTDRRFLSKIFNDGQLGRFHEIEFIGIVTDHHLAADTRQRFCRFVFDDHLALFGRFFQHKAVQRNSGTLSINKNQC